MFFLSAKSLDPCHKTTLNLTVHCLTSATQPAQGDALATGKTTTLIPHIKPSIKGAPCIAADRDHLSIANMVAVMIREHCSRVGIPIEEVRSHAPSNKKAAK
jgi:hypothetical protein